MSYANPAAEVAAGTIEIEIDGSATIKHDFRGGIRIAAAWVDIVEVEDRSRVLGEWRSKEGDAWGEFRQYELKSIEPS